MALREQSARIGRPVREAPPLEDEVVEGWRKVKQRQQQTRLDEQAVDDLVAAYKAGSPYRELVERFGINESTVVAHLQRRGVERRTFRKLRGGQLEQARDLYESGLSLRAVASELGLSKEAVRSGLVAAGVPIRGRGHRRT